MMTKEILTGNRENTSLHKGAEQSRQDNAVLLVSYRDKSAELKLQKSDGRTPESQRLVRVVLRLPKLTHLKSSHRKSLRWLKVEDKVKQIQLRQVCCCMLLMSSAEFEVPQNIWNVLEYQVPRHFSNYFNLVRDTHSYSTRESSTFRSCIGRKPFFILSGGSLEQFAGRAENNKK